MAALLGIAGLGVAFYLGDRLVERLFPPGWLARAVDESRRAGARR